MMLWILAAMGMLDAPQAEPVYLTCTFNGNPLAIELTMNEAAGRVTFSNPSNGYTQQMIGNFSAESVAFGDTRIRYTVSRVDLSITRVIDILKQTDTGKCAVKEPPKRAF